MTLALGLSGCGRNAAPGGDAAEDPTPTPQVLIQAIPTFTPTPPIPNTATPTPTAVASRPTDTPTPVSAVSSARVNVEANLRNGPGTNFSVVGTLAEGERVQPVARTRNGDWLKLADGNWIFASLVDNVVPSDLPSEVNLPNTPIPPPTSTPTPNPATATPRPTPTPTYTPIPQEGDLGFPVMQGNAFDTPDGLRIKVLELHFPQSESSNLADYILQVAGQKCVDCLAIILEIENPTRETRGDSLVTRGNQVEYVTQEDFTLYSSIQEDAAATQVDCRHFTALPRASGNIAPKGIIFSYKPVIRSLCFRNVWDDENIVRRNYLLAYTHNWFYVPDPTPTPSSSDVIEVTEALESEQAHRYGWTVYFELR